MDQSAFLWPIVYCTFNIFYPVNGRVVMSIIDETYTMDVISQTKGLILHFMSNKYCNTFKGSFYLPVTQGYLCIHVYYKLLSQQIFE